MGARSVDCPEQVVKQPRGAQRYWPTQWDDEDALTQAIVTLASQYGRYGYRRITALLQHAEKKTDSRSWAPKGPSESVRRLGRS